MRTYTSFLFYFGGVSHGAIIHLGLAPLLAARNGSVEDEVGFGFHIWRYNYLNLNTRVLMNKAYGISAEIQGYPWHDLNEEFEVDGVTIKVQTGNIEASYDNPADGEKAKKLARLYLDSYSLRSGFKITADFNRSWSPAPSGGTAHAVNLSDSITLTERLQVSVHQATITGTARIVTQEAHDSASFTNDSPMVQRALKDPTLAKALGYFAEEVADASRPLYGVYKALETITDHLGKNGREKLASFVKESKSYVSDLMETTQLERHAVTPARKLLTDNECVQRAKQLINAYANNLD